MTAYISGHLDLTVDEFKDHYVPLIDKALQEGHEFVVGDARGADALAQQYISENCATPIEYAPVRVYHMFTKPRNNVGFKVVGGFSSDEERDATMTAVSDYDIAWVRPGKENSGTAKNILRRKQEKL
jgi:hypothetical protein